MEVPQLFIRYSGSCKTSEDETKTTRSKKHCLLMPGPTWAYWNTCNSVKRKDSSISWKVGEKDWEKYWKTLVVRQLRFWAQLLYLQNAILTLFSASSCNEWDLNNVGSRESFKSKVHHFDKVCQACQVCEDQGARPVDFAWEPPRNFPGTSRHHYHQSAQHFPW